MSIGKQRILFIGAGRMAEAILAGLIQNNREYSKNITVSNRSNKEKLAELESRYGVYSTAQWPEKVHEVEVILLAMPPEDHYEVLEELNPLMNGQFVVTVAAGMGTEKLEESLPADTPVAWVMPNTAADIGESISLYTYGKSVRESHRRLLEIILAGIGESQEFSEQQIHKLTAITGSAPAFLYLFTEVLEEAAMDYGVSRKQARKLVVQMIYGSGAMLKDGREPGELRRQVTSPGGATAAGLKALKEKDFSEILKQAIEAVNTKAEEQAKSQANDLV